MTYAKTNILIPAGALGIPYDKAALAKGLEAKPDLIAIDGGSTDSGPYYLGTGTSKYSRTATKADWAVLMAARAQANVPLLIGTAGTCGADSAVDWMLDITLEIARERGETLKIATLKSGQDKDQIITAFEAGRITPLEGAPDIDTALFEQAKILWLWPGQNKFRPLWPPGRISLSQDGQQIPR